MKTKTNHLDITGLVVIILLMFAAEVSSQNIINTIGPRGMFTIKDMSGNYLTIRQGNGEVNILRSLRLENTTSSILGVLFKSTDRFLHNYGTYNTFLGVNSGNFEMTGFANTAVGEQSLYTNTSGYYNTAIGQNTLYSNTGGIGNTAIGFIAGFSITTGTNLTCIGMEAEPTTDSANNQITLGNSDVTSLRCNVQTITSLSDARDKKNITDLSLGLDFLMKVKPRLFNWDKREWYENKISDGSKIKEVPTAGFIAQELDEVQTTENAEWLNLVLKDNSEKLEASYGNLLPVMVKAIQELREENNMLKERLSKFENELNELILNKNTSISETKK